MKKLKVLSIVIFLISFLSSCAKDYHCYCDYNGSSLLYVFSETNKDDAETTCEAYEDDAGLLECELGE